MGIGGRARKDFRRRVSTYLLYSEQKAEEVLGAQSVFLPSVVGFKGSKRYCFQGFSGFRSGLSEVFGWRLSGVLLPMNEYKKDTLQNTECLIVLTCFSFVIRPSSEVERFCTFGLNSGCLITPVLN